METYLDPYFNKSVLEELDNSGKEGWELVSVVRHEGKFYFFYKRQVEDYPY